MLLVVGAHQCRVDGQTHGDILGAAARGLDGNRIGRGQFVDREALHRHLLGAGDEQAHLLIVKLVSLAVTAGKQPAGSQQQ